jgi:hypothetical protein
MVMDFKNLGFFSSIFQSVANTASNTVRCVTVTIFTYLLTETITSLQIFEGIKPYILKDAYVKIKAALDEALDKIVGTGQIPNSISPIDHAIADARKQIREKG